MNEYYEYFGPTYQLDVLPTNMEDLNTPEYLEKVKIQVFENLRHTGFAPSVQMSGIPKLDHDDMEVDEDLDSPDVRKSRRFEGTLFNRYKCIKLTSLWLPFHPSGREQSGCETLSESMTPNSKNLTTKTTFRRRG